jgi:kynureninase
LPAATAPRLDAAIRSEWGQGLIRSWNTANWIGMPRQIGIKLARLLGAHDDEIVATDSTSVNLFKLLAGALQLAADASPDRQIILSERGNFPTDLYMAQGLNALLGNRYTLKLVDADEIVAALDTTVAVVMLTQVDYCTGRLHDMAAVNTAAHAVGTRVIWDLSHSAGALPIALNESGAELAVGCGYKYLNGGPGAPAYVYVHRDLHARFATPLAGWFGHAAPFSFDQDYRPAPGIDRLLCGTPSVLAMHALDCGLDTFDGIDLASVRAKSIALADMFRQLMDEQCAGFGLTCVSPTEPARRGSQLSFAHESAYAIMQAIIARGVIGDFRQPHLMRFGFTPLYLRFVDVWDAVATIRDVMQSRAFEEKRFQQRHAVT